MNIIVRVEKTITTPDYYKETLWQLGDLGETLIMLPWRTLVYNIVCIN